MRDPSSDPTPDVPDVAASSAVCRGRFLLDERVETIDAPGGLLVLDWLRRRGYRGTKEGCREGDCGACTVLVGELVDGNGEGQRIRYRPVTSCLLPVAELEGKHLVTVAGLTPGGPDGASPVQRAVVEAGASQCGFCTPGIVVSLTAMLLDPLPPDSSPAVDPRACDPVVRALSGHLCRCTGYRSLREAGARILEQDREQAGDGSIEERVHQGWLPTHFLDAPKRLTEWAAAASATAKPSNEDGRRPPLVVAGGTDLYVQQGEELPRRPIRVLASSPELRGICEVGEGCEVEEGGPKELRIGALTTFEELGESELLRRRVPRIIDHLFRIASWQVRNRATVGGNLVNASPIGDITILALALGADVVLAGPGGRRRLPLERFYLDYKELDLQPGEVLEELRLPPSTPSTDERFTFQKVSKRPCLDIATVNAAARIRLAEGRIVDARLAAGGVAPVPLFLRRASKAVVGLELPAAPDDGPLSDAFARELDTRLAAASAEISPIDDVRGSSLYKRLLLRQLLLACFVDLLPEALPGALAIELTHGPSRRP